MKFNILLKTLCVIVFFSLPVICLGDDTGVLFTKGNNLYTKGQYEAAAKVYSRLIDQGYQSPELYFNMGNASYKNGDIPSAILYYEKARKLSPGDEDINFNLKYVNLKTTDKIDETPEFFLTSWWKALILTFSVNALALWSIVFILIASGLLILYFFAEAENLKKASFYAAIALFLLGISTTFIANRQVNYFNDHHGAIVFSGSVNVKNGPVEKSNTLFVIHDGTRVDVIENNNGWLKIKLANGNEGWIKEADIKEI